MSEYVKVARASDVPPGARVIVRLPDDGTRVAVFNVDGKLYCIADVCTHDGGPVAEGELDRYSIECPRHGARFDIRDGRVLAPPAVVPVDTYDVRLDGEDILVSAEPNV